MNRRASRERARSHLSTVDRARRCSCIDSARARREAWRRIILCSGRRRFPPTVARWRLRALKPAAPGTSGRWRPTAARRGRSHRVAFLRSILAIHRTEQRLCFKPGGRSRGGSGACRERAVRRSPSRPRARSTTSTPTSLPTDDGSPSRERKPGTCVCISRRWLAARLAG